MPALKQQQSIDSIEAESKMQRVFSECKVICDVFESIYVYKSIIVCNDTSIMYHMHDLLKTLLFPICIVSQENHIETLQSLLDGNIRMLIMSQPMFDVITEYHMDKVADVDVIFLSSQSVISDQATTYFSNDTRKIISL